MCDDQGKKEGKEPLRETWQEEEGRGAVLEMLTVVTKQGKLKVSISFGRVRSYWPSVGEGKGKKHLKLVWVLLSRSFSRGSIDSERWPCPQHLT